MEQNGDPDIDPHKYGFNLFFTKEQKQFNEEDMAFSINGAREVGHPKQKRQKSKTKTKIYNLNLILYAKFNSIWITELNKM